MKYTYQTQGGVCAHTIEFEIENDTVKSVVFHGGCPGNHLGIAQLAEGMSTAEVIRRLSGICCGMRRSSCPDQLACAVKKYLQEYKEK